MEFALDLWYENTVWFLFTPSLTFPVSAPLKWGSWRVPKVFSSSIVCKPEIKNDKPGTKLMLAVALSKEMGEKFIAHAWRGGSAWCFSHAFKHPQTSIGRHDIEKNEPPSCLGAQNFPHRWVPEDLIYKIEPASCACRIFLVINLWRSSVLHWPGHWSCSVCKA